MDQQKLMMRKVSNCMLYAGLSWQVVVGFGGMKRLVSQARLQECTHTVVSGSIFKSFGVLKQANIEKRKLITHHSAAACFARMHMKAAHAVVLQFTTGDVWLLAVSDGAVLVKGDQCFSDLALAQRTIKELQQSSPQLNVRYVEKGEEFLDSLQGYCSSVTQLKVLVVRHVWPYLLLSAALFLSLIVWIWSSELNADASETNSVLTITNESKALGSSYALEALLGEWYSLKSHYGVWALSKVNCTLNMPKQWFCFLTLHSDANNHQNESPVIQGWDVVEKNENRMRFQRHISYVEPSYIAQTHHSTKAAALTALEQSYGKLFHRFERNEASSSVLIEGPLRALVLVREAASELKQLHIELELLSDSSAPTQTSQLLFRLKGEQR